MYAFWPCRWDYGVNQACDGGDYQPAITYIVQAAGGAAMEADYPYEGVDNFCRAQKTASPSLAAGSFIGCDSRDVAVMQFSHLHSACALRHWVRLHDMVLVLFHCWERPSSPR